MFNRGRSRCGNWWDEVAAGRAESCLLRDVAAHQQSEEVVNVQLRSLGLRFSGERGLCRRPGVEGQCGSACELWW
jgi:hypothetical protein